MHNEFYTRKVLIIMIKYIISDKAKDYYKRVDKLINGRKKEICQ